MVEIPSFQTKFFKVSFGFEILCVLNSSFCAGRKCLEKNVSVKISEKCLHNGFIAVQNRCHCDSDQGRVVHDVRDRVVSPEISGNLFRFLRKFPSKAIKWPVPCFKNSE